jgi:hypothetical protein
MIRRIPAHGKQKAFQQGERRVLQGRTALRLDQMPSLGLESVREFVHQAGFTDTRIADQVNQSAPLERFGGGVLQTPDLSGTPDKTYNVAGLADLPGPNVIGAYHAIGGNWVSESLEGFETTIFEPNVFLG